MLPVGFEPTISACKQPKTYALDRAATGTGTATTTTTTTTTNNNNNTHRRHVCNFQIPDDAMHTEYGLPTHQIFHVQL